MKLNVLGVKRIQGTSSKTGNAFDMCNLIATTPIAPFANGKTTIAGYGLEPVEMPLEPAAVEQFSKLQGQFPLTLDLETDTQPFMGKLETVVVGIKAVVSPVKSAA